MSLTPPLPFFSLRSLYIICHPSPDMYKVASRSSVRVIAHINSAKWPWPPTPHFQDSDHLSVCVSAALLFLTPSHITQSWLHGHCRALEISKMSPCPVSDVLNQWWPDELPLLLSLLLYGKYPNPLGWLLKATLKALFIQIFDSWTGYSIWIAIIRKNCCSAKTTYFNS